MSYYGFRPYVPVAKRRLLAVREMENGGQKLSRGALYLILQNRIYRGEIPRKGNSYPGNTRRLSTHIAVCAPVRRLRSRFELG
jgi:hypothetical protein